VLGGIQATQSVPPGALVYAHLLEFVKEFGIYPHPSPAIVGTNPEAH